MKRHLITRTLEVAFAISCVGVASAAPPDPPTYYTRFNYVYAQSFFLLPDCDTLPNSNRRVSGGLCWDYDDTTLKYWNGAALVAASGTATPPGSSGDLPFNNSGTFGAIPDSDWNGTTLTLPPTSATTFTGNLVGNAATATTATSATTATNATQLGGVAAASYGVLAEDEAVTGMWEFGNGLDWDGDGTADQIWNSGGSSIQFTKDLLIDNPAYFQDVADDTDNLLQLWHLGDGYGIDISNRVGAGSPMVIHNYSDDASALVIDNTQTKTLLTLRNAENASLSPGTEGSGNFLSLWGYGATAGTMTWLGHLSPSLAFTARDTTLPWTFTTHTGVNVVALQIVQPNAADILSATDGSNEVFNVARDGTVTASAFAGDLAGVADSAAEANEIDADRYGTPELYHSGAGIYVNPGEGNPSSSGWEIGNNSLTVISDVVGRFRSFGYIQIRADADNDGVGGEYAEVDADGDNTADATHYAGRLALNQGAGAILFGTCGASECICFDLDNDGTIEATDVCMVDGGPDADCDGTAE